MQNKGKSKAPLSVVLVGLGCMLACACAAKGVSTDEVVDHVDASPTPDLGRRDAAADATAEAAAQPDAAPTKDAGTDSAVVSKPDADAEDAMVCNPILFFAPIGLPECDMCLTNECCDITQACLRDADCNALSNCVFLCDGPDAGNCIQDCGAQHPASAGKMNAWVSCLNSKCSGYCS